MPFDETPILVSITPDQKISLPVSSDYHSLFSQLSREEASAADILCRITLEDNTGFGVILPGSISFSDHVISFVLPEQLCIFSPTETYICKAEVILETQYLLPFIGHAQIVLNAPGEAANVPDAPTVEKESEASEKAISSSDDGEEDLELALSIIAPEPILAVNEAGKMKLEDLSEEFVNSALWKREQQPQAPEPGGFLREPEPVAVREESPEKAALRKKMKSLLRGMLTP